MTTLDISVLGELEVRVGRQDRTPRGRLPRAVFSILVARLGTAVSTDALIEAAWNGSPPKSARSSLRVHISRIREAVDLPDLLVTTDHGYRLQTDPQTIDAYRFELGVQEGRRLLEAGAAGRAEAVLHAALEEWRGEPYVDAEFAEALQSEVARLVRSKREAEVDLAAAALETAGSKPDTTSLEALAQADPLDERRWGLLMKGLFRSGRQAEALAAYRRASQHLGEELGLEPGPELQALEEQILLHDPALFPADDAPMVDLPGFATSLVGRSEQVTLVAKRLVEHRLVTVTGLGGVGKTRVAVAAAHAAAADFADGAVFVPLDPVADDALVADAILTQIGLSPSADPIDGLVDHLVDRQMVLVLDNCEQVLEGVGGLVGRLLAACPGVGLLCTSRIPIGVTAETLFPVNPLPVPPSDLEFTTPSELLRYESISLFCDRAASARPEFTLDAENGPVVAEIVRRLAGIPLSIELACATSDLLNPADILDRIDASPLSLAAGERDRTDRHQSMADAVAWSLDLLDEPARTLFERMSVFQSPVTSHTIEVVCEDGLLDAAAVHGSLAALARSALVTVDFGAAHARYGQLPPLRDVALAKLGEEEQGLRDRHLEHFATLAGAEVEHVGRPEEAASFERLVSNLDELRSALHHAAAHCPEPGRQMCIDLGTFWMRSGRTAEGRGWVARFLDGEDAQPDVVASLHHLAGSLALVEQDLDAAERALTTALELRRGLGSSQELGMTLSNLGGLANSRREYERAESLFREALEVFVEEGFRRGAAAARLNLGLVLLNTDRTEDAVDELQRAVDGFRRVGDRAEESHALVRLGYALAAVGDLARAEACRLAALHISEELGRAPDVAYGHMTLAAHYLETGALDRSRDHAAASAELVLGEDLQRWWVPDLVELAAAVSAAAGDPALGARLSGCAAAFRRAHGHPVADSGKAFVDETQQRLEEILSRERFLVEFEVGGTRRLLDGVATIAAWQ